MRKIVMYILMPVIIIVFSTFFMSTNQSFYFYQFEKNDTYQSVDLPVETLPEVVEHLTKYLLGTEPSFNHQVEIDGKLQYVYGEREVLHMIDVRRIFDIIKYIALLSGLFFIYEVYRHYKKHQFVDYLVSVSTANLIGIVTIVIALLVLVIIDFSKYFIVFHEIFFSNDLWLLDPRTDVLIQMLPQQFFMEIVIWIIALSVIISAVFFVMMRLIKQRRLNRHV